MVILYAVFSAAVYCLVGVSFSIVYGTGRVFDFGHAAALIAGPYCVFYLLRSWDVPLAATLPVAVLFSATLGIAKEALVYNPLRNKKSSPLILMIASIGLYLVLQNSISLMFGDDPKNLLPGIVREGFPFLRARITPVQLTILITAFTTVVGTILFLHITKTGMKIRAVRENPELASLVGVDAYKMRLISAFWGSALVGLSGILIGLDVGITPTMGMRALLMGIVAMIIGGSGSPLGIALGASLLGLSGNLAVQFFGSQWQDPVLFIILVTFLLFRPQGFMGRKIKTAEV